MSDDKKEQRDLFPGESNIENPSPKLVSLLNRIEAMYEQMEDLAEWETHGEWARVEEFCYSNRSGLMHADVKRLIQFGEKIRQLKGPGRHLIEEGVFKILYSQLFHLHKQFDTEDSPFPIKREELGHIFEGNSELKEKMAAFLDIEAFAYDSYEFKRVRDSYAGNRRALSLNLLMELLYYFESSKSMELAKRSLKNKGSAVLNAAFEFLRNFYVSRDRDIEDDLVEQLIKISETTKKRSIAIGALSVLVDTGMISEMHAVEMMSDWKEKNYYR